MIFAAGLGTRLKPLTDRMPKALVPVGGIPMLQHVILKLKQAGFSEIVINIHHFGEQIINFLQANQNFGITIHISDERDELLDTGGGIKKAAPFFSGNEPYLIGYRLESLIRIASIQYKRCHFIGQPTGNLALPVI